MEDLIQMPLIKSIKYLILQCNRISYVNAPTKDGGLYVECTLEYNLMHHMQKENN